jgi:hypothetical protein
MTSAAFGAFKSFSLTRSLEKKEGKINDITKT